MLACDYPAHLDFWTALLDRLGVRPRHTHDAPTPGIVVTSTVDRAGQRLLHVLNVSPVDQSFSIHRDGTPLLGGTRLTLPARTGRMLPLDLHLPSADLLWSTAELAESSDTLTLKAADLPARALIRTTGELDAPGAEITRDGPLATLTWSTTDSVVITVT
ncbi:hypothetical protein ACFPJ1_23825 [Kribbella qitaiheensis]|uniref:hypothetical protein n=1 Tax=Kribbella qitaiheensis TaxID=1544730 RepID=UPI00361D9957